jgi:di/tripeptidase
VPALLVGFGLPRSNPHAPNERISLTANDRGVATIMDLLTRVGDRTSQEAELRGT